MLESWASDSFGRDVKGIGGGASCTLFLKGSALDRASLKPVFSASLVLLSFVFSSATQCFSVANEELLSLLSAAPRGGGGGSFLCRTGVNSVSGGLGDTDLRSGSLGGSCGINFCPFCCSLMVDAELVRGGSLGATGGGAAGAAAAAAAGGGGGGEGEAVDFFWSINLRSDATLILLLLLLLFSHFDGVITLGCACFGSTFCLLSPSPALLLTSLFVRLLTRVCACFEPMFLLLVSLFFQGTIGGSLA